VENGDRIRERKNDVHVVLDDDQGSSGSDPVDHFYRSRRLLPGHACSRFIEKDQLRIRREGNAYFQSPLPAVGQGTRRYVADIGEPDALNNLFGLGVDPFYFSGSLEEVVTQSLMAAHPGTDIVQNSNFLEYIRNLKGSGNAQTAKEMRWLSRDVLIFENDRTCRWFEPAADNVKQGCLACPVRPDDRMPFS